VYSCNPGSFINVVIHGLTNVLGLNCLPDSSKTAHHIFKCF
jgi:hypothetical protein